MKLTCGFEMLAEQAAKRNEQSPGNNFLDKKFQHFVKKLTESGYFQGELVGSEKYRVLLEQARQFYSSNDDDDTFRFSDQILQMSKIYRLEEAKETGGENLESSDDESWLDVEPESFDALLRQHFKLEGEPSDNIPAQKSESELPTEIKRFLQSLSEFDGIQVLALQSAFQWIN
jgi:hypothetical protein